MIVGAGALGAKFFLLAMGPGINHTSPMRKKCSLAIALMLLAGFALVGLAQKTKDDSAKVVKVLILDGQNNHKWQETTPVLQQIFGTSDRFSVEVSTSPGAKASEEEWDKWRPEFFKYDVVVSNYNGQMWPGEVRAAFVEYVKKGGGFVVVHAANNSWPEWQAFNEMIGLGGWGGRNEASGPYVYYNDAGERIVDASPGPGGSHGPQREFQLTTRDDSHPIMQGIPEVWMHTQDECYDRLRGPAQNLTVLATAFADPDHKGSGRHEPMLMSLTYGEGRIFHSTLGHDDYSFESVGFITTFLRGAEWAATGTVTIPVPEDFPTAEASSARAYPGP